MTLDEILAAAEALPLAKHEELLTKIRTAYYRRWQDNRRQRRAKAAVCPHAEENRMMYRDGAWVCRLCDTYRPADPRGD